MKNVVLILLVIFSFSACKQSKETTTKSKETIFIKMERTPCFGKCPSYIITIFNDGKVIYEGKTFSAPKGKHTTTLSTAEIKKLKDKIVAIGFFNLKDKYDSQITDIPSCFITINMDNKEKKIMDRVDAPKELRALEKMIDNLIITNRLVKIEK